MLGISTDMTCLLLDAFSIGGVILQLFAPNLAAFVIGRFWNA